MMKRFFHWNLSVLLLLVLCSCGGTSPSASYFTLSPMDMKTSETLPLSLPPDTAIGIGPVTFPDTYDRPSIITKEGPNQISINEFHRWAGSLKQNFTQVMTQNLATLLQSDQIMARPWERYFKPDIRITMDIQSFTGQLGSFAELKATWMIIDETGQGEALVHRSEFKEPVIDDGYSAFVGAQSRVLARFSKEIAEAILSK